MTTPISIATADHYLWGDNCDGWHLVRAAELGIIQERVPPSACETRHVHARAHQFFYILEGEAVIEVDGQRHVLPARTGLEIAPGLPHQFRNETTEDVVFLVVSQPPSQADRQPAPPVDL